MDIKSIYNELYQNGFLSTSIDYDEFIAGFTDYTHISTLRKDLIIRDYEVVDVFTFFEEIVDEIPQLSKNEYRNWRLFSLDNTDFLVVNQFDNRFKNFNQWIYFFNEQEDIELLTEIDSPEKFYNKSSSYLNSLPTQFEDNFIDYSYNNVSEPMVVQLLKSHSRGLCRNGEHRAANDFLEKSGNFIKSNNLNKLYQNVEDSYQEFNLYNEIKGKVLHSLEYDDFDSARATLKPNFNNLSEGSYEDIESIIEDAERRYHRSIELNDQAEVEAAQEEIDKVRRAKRANEAMLQSQMRHQEEQQRRALQQQENEIRNQEEAHRRSEQEREQRINNMKAEERYRQDKTLSEKNTKPISNSIEQLIRVESHNHVPEGAKWVGNGYAKVEPGRGQYIRVEYNKNPEGTSWRNYGYAEVKPGRGQYIRAEYNKNPEGTSWRNYGYAEVMK